MAFDERIFRRAQRGAVTGGGPTAIRFADQGASESGLANFEKASEETERHGEDR
jgi:hypothetical protein